MLKFFAIKLLNVWKNVDSDLYHKMCIAHCLELWLSDVLCKWKYVGSVCYCKYFLQREVFL